MNRASSDRAKITRWGGVRFFVLGGFGLFSPLVCHTAQGRVLVVAADGSGEFLHVMQAAAVDSAGDTILVRDGDYLGIESSGEYFDLDSDVVLMAEHSGQARVWLAPIENRAIGLFDSAQVIGVHIIGNFMSMAQRHIAIYGPGRIYNCRLTPATANFGWGVWIQCNGQPPEIAQCRFDFTGGVVDVTNNDSTNIWMPNNYWGTMDTAQVHMRIGGPGRDFVYVSPVLESFEWLSADEREPLATQYVLYQNYPNPFNPITEIRFELPENVHVELSIFNTLGQRVAMLIDEIRPAGSYHVQWDGFNVASGAYLYQLKAGTFTESRKMVLLR